MVVEVDEVVHRGLRRLAVDRDTSVAELVRPLLVGLLEVAEGDRGTVGVVE